MIISSLLVDDLIEWLEEDLKGLYFDDAIKRCRELIKELKQLQRRQGD